ncbi:MAG: hypothetical protein U9R24_02445 [Thermodesulfobacteriota bacterium]|nr:hypothetical protein [Thermodesulfobacteriota bacterium]
MPKEHYPLSQFRHLASRIDQESFLYKYRRWTGNDDFEHHYHIAIPITQKILYLNLSWKRNSSSNAQFIGIFRLDMENLLSEGYIRKDGGDKVRLRICHGNDNILYIQTRSGKPALAIGKLQ